MSVMLLGVRRALWIAAGTLIAWPASADGGVRPAPARVELLAARAPSQPRSVAELPGGLSLTEREQLLAGDTVSRPLEFERGEQRFVGGLSYQLVRAQPEEVLAALQNVDDLPNALPRTKAARLVGGSGRSAQVELVQGNSVVEATYTVRLVREQENLLRFWLDHERPHDIDDVWGYFRVHRFDRDRTLVTVAVALDVGPGLVRLLFEGRIQNVILATPRHIRDYIEPRAVAAR